jgi:hypothetical protein
MSSPSFDSTLRFTLACEQTERSGWYRSKGRRRGDRFRQGHPQCTFLIISYVVFNLIYFEKAFTSGKAISSASNTLESIKDYARSLLASLPDSKNNPPSSVVHDVNKPNGHGVELSRSVKRAEEEREKNTEGGLSGCREAVEILTRNPKKGMLFFLLR